MPIVLAWMKLRFGLISPELPFSLPLFGYQPSMVFWFILFYIPLRMFSNKTITRWQLRRGWAQAQTQDLGAQGSPAEAQTEGQAEAENQTGTPKVDKP